MENERVVSRSREHFFDVLRGNHAGGKEFAQLGFALKCRKTIRAGVAGRRLHPPI